MPKKLLRDNTKMHGGGPEKQTKKATGSDKSGGKQEFDGRSFLGRDPSERGGIPGRDQGTTVCWEGNQVASKNCAKCGRFIQDSLMPFCDRCMMQKPSRKESHADRKIPPHWEEGFEPYPAA